MSEANLLTSTLLIEIPKRFPKVRLWRQNTGGGVGMSTVKRAVGLLQQNRISDAITLLLSRPIKFGIEGGGDISGVAGPHGRRIEIEIKTGKDRQSESQIAFAAMIRKAGGLYIVARSVEQCLEDLEFSL